MTIYSYKATDLSGKIIKGTLEALNEKGAVSRLQEMGYIPITVHQTGKKAENLNIDIVSLFSRISNKDVMHFTQDLSALLKAGLPVDRALSISIDTAEKEKFKKIIQDILKSVEGGSYLSDAMAKYPQAFSDFYVNMIRAGEAGGVLEPVLERLGVFLESAQELKDYIKSALIYPAFLVFVGGISIIILMTFVIPKFSMIFSDMGQAIPLSTKILLDTSEFLRSYWWAILSVIIGTYILFWRYTQTSTGRLWLDTYKIKLPVMGELVKKIEVARFSRTLGTLVKSGVPILQALELVKNIINNQIIAGSMRQIHESVKEGERLSTPLAAAGIFPSLAVQMIRVGEESGHLDEMLLRIAENYEKVIKNTVKRLISFLEPAMILCMGVVVGFIVISMLMAIFSMNEVPF